MSSEQMISRISAQAESLEAVLKHHNGEGREALDRAARLLRSRSQLVITGMGASFYAALVLETQLCLRGINAIAVEAGELLHFRQRAYPEAAVLIVSRSGESIEVTKLLDSLKGRQPIVGVCNRSQSTLSREADVALVVGSLEDDVVALQTYTGTVLALALLGSAMVEELAQTRRHVEELLPGYDALIQSSLRERTEWDAFLQDRTSFYLLARGGSFASALEGALLFHEVAKVPATAMLAASFRHGPVEAVSDSYRATVFAPDGPTQKLSVALARDIVRFAGQVRVIGHFEGGFPDVPVVSLPRTPGWVTPIFEIAPLQAAALRLAETQGIVPGSFRFIPPVALDEASFG